MLNQSTILSLYERMRISENLYSLIFYVVYWLLVSLNSNCDTDELNKLLYQLPKFSQELDACPPSSCLCQT